MQLLRALPAVLLLGGLLFGVAGRWDLPYFWAIVVLFTGYVFAATTLLDPELARERVKPAEPGPDRAYRFLLGSFLVTHLAVAALDTGRFHWSEEVPSLLRMAGIAGYALSLLFVLWALRGNRFFVPAVRIQAERNHRVVRSGPYRWIRHPGYLGSAIGALFGALALGSWLAFIPLLGALGVLSLRTAFEDRYLQDHLAGYTEYAREVPYRLLPGIW